MVQNNVIIMLVAIAFKHYSYNDMNIKYLYHTHYMRNIKNIRGCKKLE